MDLDDSVPVGRLDRHAEPDLKDRLSQAIDDLPEGYRVVFVMHDVEGYTHEEIAELPGRPSGYLEGAAVPGPGPACGKHWPTSRRNEPHAG